MRLVSEGEETLSQEELTLVALNSYEKGELTKEEYHYLENVFEFDDTLAKDIQVTVRPCKYSKLQKPSKKR